MQFNRKNLISTLRTIGGVIPRKGKQPILSCVSISHRGTVYGTNLDQYLEIDVMQMAGAPCTQTLCTPVHALIKVLSGMSETNVWFDYDQRADQWTANRIVIEHIDPRDMPEAPALLDDSVEHLVPASDIVHMLDKCYFAASKLGGKELLSSIAWKGTSIAATDGSRLSHVELLDHGIDVLLDSELMANIGKLLKCSIGDVAVAVYGGITRIKSDNWCTWMRNISGEYPRYQELFRAPGDWKQQLSFKRDDMLAKLKHVGVRLDKRSNKLVIDCEANEIWCEDEDGFRATMHTDIDKTGMVPTFAVSYHYWKQAVESMGENVTVDFEGALKPLIFRDGNYKHLLMPIQVDKPKTAKPVEAVKKPSPRADKHRKLKGQDAKVAETSEKKLSGAPSSSVEDSAAEVVGVSSATNDTADDKPVAVTPAVVPTASAFALPNKPPEMPDKVYQFVRSIWLKNNGVVA